ncbi:IS701 family transposase [Streptomyces sp. NPDC002722]|uniref:IS701 family transposase n=1 Tax=Streptomyces sp. NPDC002722 TaxID=3154425 RepID=UPI003318EF13
MPGRIAGRFGRVEPRLRVLQLALGLLADLPRRNCSTIAEHAGDTSPDGLQHLLGQAKWDADLVRDDLRAFVLDHLADDQAVLVVDETGDLKKGTHTVGVQRQYTGTAGRIENAQVAVYLTYTSRHGHVGIDRALCLPESWTSDPQRCRRDGAPEDIGCATKPQLAAQMIERALDAGAPAAWAAGDEVYGDNPHLRTALEGRQFDYVLAISRTHRLPTPFGPQRADRLARRIPRLAWHKLSAGRGAKGHRWYDWTHLALAAPGPAGHQYLLTHRITRAPKRVDGLPVLPARVLQDA